VRAGDIYALLIETYHDKGMITQARDLYLRMITTVPIRLVPYYMDQGMIEKLDPQFKERLRMDMKTSKVEAIVDKGGSGGEEDDIAEESIMSDRSAGVSL
jgi:hypothetical protein